MIGHKETEIQQPVLEIHQRWEGVRSEARETGWFCHRYRSIYNRPRTKRPLLELGYLVGFLGALETEKKECGLHDTVKDVDAFRNTIVPPQGYGNIGKRFALAYRKRPLENCPLLWRITSSEGNVVAGGGSMEVRG